MSVLELRAGPSDQQPGDATRFPIARLTFIGCKCLNDELLIEVSRDTRSLDPPSLPVLFWYRLDDEMRHFPLEIMRTHPDEQGGWWDMPDNLPLDVEQLPAPIRMPNGAPFNGDGFIAYARSCRSMTAAIQDALLATACAYLKAQCVWYLGTPADTMPSCLLLLTYEPPNAQGWTNLPLRLPEELEPIVRVA